MLSVHFDDLIYSLQPFGGASVYWNELTSRVGNDPRFHVARSRSSKLGRGLPVHTRADLFHSSHFGTPWPRKVKSVSTVHDLNYELGYVRPSLGARLNILERRISYFSADALICISESTRRELLTVYPQLASQCPIHVIHHGYSVLSADADTVTANPRKSPYILYVGARKAYKRFVDALLGFYESRLWEYGSQLVCTGEPFDSSEMYDIHRLGLSQHVVCVGKVTPSALAALYRYAHCLVYSSVHEGFGLPLVEAMDCACPVIACNTSCIPEIVGDAAILVPVQSPAEISAAILSLDDPHFRAEMIAKGLERVNAFSWDRSALAHMTVYLNTYSGSRTA
jgi:mannosyltransferase